MVHFYIHKFHGTLQPFRELSKLQLSYREKFTHTLTILAPWQQVKLQHVKLFCICVPQPERSSHDPQKPCECSHSHGSIVPTEKPTLTSYTKGKKACCCLLRASCCTNVKKIKVAEPSVPYLSGSLDSISSSFKQSWKRKGRKAGRSRPITKGEWMETV